MNEQIVILTDKAKGQIRNIIAKEEDVTNKGLRLAVIGGGCSGFSYKIELSEIKEKDNVVDYDDFRVLIDPKSSIYLKGVQLDYQDGLEGKGFVFSNPNAKNTCGCGESFSL